MGGAIKVIVRFSDGTVVADTRGTNALPAWVCQPQTISGDESLMRRYVTEDSPFRDDDHTYTPVEYGTFTIDFLTKTIIAANDYTDCKTMVITDVRWLASRFSLPDGLVSPMGALYQMLSGGYLYLESRPLAGYVEERGRAIMWYDADAVHYVPHRVDLRHVDPDTWDRDIYRTYGEAYDEDHRMKPFDYYLCVNFEGWTHIGDLGRGVADQDTAREKMREIGLPISDADEAAYQAWRSARLAYEEESRREQAEYDAQQKAAMAAIQAERA